jgi:hypothetical protein
MYHKFCAKKYFHGFIRKDLYVKVVCIVKFMIKIYALESVCKKVMHKNYIYKLYFSEKESYGEIKLSRKGKILAIGDRS